MRKNDRKNGIAVHAWDKGHQVKWESAKVKEVETSLANRRIMEGLDIQRLPHTTNLDCGLTIDPCLVPPPVLTITPYTPCLRSLYLKSSLLILSQPALATACITTPYVTFPSHLFPATFPLISRHTSTYFPPHFRINTVASHLC